MALEVTSSNLVKHPSKYIINEVSKTIYDYLIVGCGLFGAVCAWRLKQNGKNVLIIDKREHIGGNIYTEYINGIHCHKYGAHIFHTSNKEVWEFVNKFAEFESFYNCPIANYNGEYYNLPFNMHTFYQIYGIRCVQELEDKMNVWNKYINVPHNIEEFAIKSVGEKAYEYLIKGYTEKQWMQECKNLPHDIIKRIPVRKTWDNNYYDDLYQGIPINGYTELIQNMICGIDLKLGMEFDLNEHYGMANKIIYCGSPDKILNYSYGVLPYRSLRFEYHYNDESIGIPVMNFTSIDIPYTRVIDHKLFLRKTKQLDNTMLTYEYPQEYNIDKEPYYPIRTQSNLDLYRKYVDEITVVYPKIILGGRLGLYEYLDMDKCIEKAFELNI